MHLTRLRLSGFKTFVDPVDVPIEPGLTGIVGPNGCGKSNLVEAMRWAMGESSHKALRAAEMDDVIFAGNGRRPARNLAEVSLKIDNDARRAPAEFNASDEIEIVRVLSRGSGSSYRVNGREARARDVQTLFADVSSGARSPSLIGQGRVAEIIHARPEQRRRLLEDAAGIAGLSARRHEAELRLKAAEQNLERAEDVLTQMDSRIEALRRQARTAVRYRQLSAELRRLEQVRMLLAWREAQAAVVGAESTSALAAASLASAVRAQGEAARAEALAEHALPQRRAEAAGAAAHAQELLAQLAHHQAAEKAARTRLSELAGQAEAAERDLLRERQLADDAERTLARLQGELEQTGANSPDDAAVGLLALRLQEAETSLQAAEAALSDVTTRQAETNARRSAAKRARDEAAARLSRARGEAQRLADTALAGPDLPALAELATALHRASADLEAAEAAAHEAEASARLARDAEREAQTALGAAEKRSAALGAEAATLRKLVHANRGKAARPVFDDIEVEPGFERALAAALGEDLDASLAPEEPRHWVLVDGAEELSLPAGVDVLSAHIRAPEALRRSLNQTGIVAREEGPALRHRLQPGQRLVSIEGDLWRWDGFTQSAAAQGPTARRLAERNRLDAVAAQADLAEAESARLAGILAQARDAVRHRTDAHQRATATVQTTRRAASAARERSVEGERAHAAADARRAAHEETRSRLAAVVAEAEAAYARAESELAGIPEAMAGDEEAVRLRQAVTVARSRRIEAAAEHEAERRAIAERARRGEALTREVADWSARKDSAAIRAAELVSRIESLEAARARLVEVPEEAALSTRRIGRELEVAQQAAQAAADALATAETERNNLARLARTALDAMSAAREEQARTDERLATARARLAEAAAAIQDSLGETPHKLAASTDLGGIGARSEMESDIARVTQDRERLGPVNLAADTELTQVQAGRDTLVAEREDITQAIRQLRRGIQTLNEEGRTRLLAAFERVDANFRKLFATLFDGGAASLELIETEDPLGAGLEVNAQPPGKRPHTLSLLSGGEQALTALALVFAVFLACPSPVCVLDEVDAPLDDANVERFCALLSTMTAQTSTRFLVVTHNPITMSRMDRLIGVTMAERGVSQLVTVALAEAERFQEAG